KLAEQNNNLRAAVGVHPSEWNGLDFQTTRKQIEKITKNLKKIIQEHNVAAIGETGLDFFRIETADAQSRENQAAAFRAHIALADEHALPLIIHARDTTDEAYTAILENLKKYKKNDTPVILHCMSGPVEYIKEAVRRGYFFGVAGNVTYKNADELRKKVALVPPGQLLLETDAPFLPPNAHRGEVCQPYFIAETAEYVRAKLNRDLEEIYQTTCRVFGAHT
ncbi:TatD family hydrolase, partial [Candidatus Woesebacteria bacterium]|nr:TatD family hydrolase [Candidatus Woesebacteria bacterium]